MKRSILAMAFGAALAAGGALAHGEAPKHNGVVSSAGELHFELVNRSGTPVIYVEDHGKKQATAAFAGKLTLLNGTEKTEVLLQPGGGNMLVGNGMARMAKGTKAMASITFADSKVVNVRFAMQ